jgi:hypothetical protein
MTVSLTPNDIREIAEIASIVGTIVSVIVFGLVAYLLVRPKRRREAVPEAERIEIEEMMALMDRMERRLDAVERLVARDEEPVRIAAPDKPEILEAADRRELGRTK